MLLDADQIEAQYQRGHAAHRAGELDQAEDIYERILTQSPDHAPTLNALSGIQLRRGNVQRAETLIRHALKIDPLSTGFNTTLGSVLVARGLYDQAREAFERELQLRPDFAIAHNQLGSLALMQQRPDLATGHFERALEHAPGFAVAANNLGRALFQNGQYRRAAQAFRQALSADEEFADAHARLGRALHELAEHADAREHLERALALDDRLGLALRGLAELDIAAGNTADALRSLETAVQVDPGDQQALSLLGKLLYDEGLFERAASVYARALDLYPEDPELLSAAAAVSRANGDVELARDRYKAALAQRATHQAALAGLGQLMADAGDAKGAAARLAPSVNSGRAGPELLSTYADILGRLGRRREGITLLEAALQKRQPPEVARQLHFALATLLDGEGSYDLAFFHCRRANDGRPAPFDPDAFCQLIDQIIENFEPARPALPESDWHAPAPIFVVGLPRSGVRVVAKLMSPHRALVELGPSSSVENSILQLWHEAGARWPTLPRGLTAQDASRAAHRALSGRLGADTDRPMFMDANWRNFLYVGVIARLFPGARFIECTRDARDVARSCYFRNAEVGRTLAFASDFGHLAAFVNGYRRLMDHWRSSPALKIHRVSYEQLVLDAASQSRRISEFLELPHSDLDYALETGADAPWHLDAKALRRYRHYRSHLEAFTEALDAPPDS
jgi:tetratricopeptide (TPR) repeat protein